MHEGIMSKMSLIKCRSNTWGWKHYLCTMFKKI